MICVVYLQYVGHGERMRQRGKEHKQVRLLVQEDSSALERFIYLLAGSRDEISVCSRHFFTVHLVYVDVSNNLLSFLVMQP